ncbi:MAG: hypothetical protein B6D56_01760 [Candidatus Omnitrophica bacterium 4484_70.1]|nr:MAG: hypothetical protein B6D56_01760 [Candidatus Omnitrophica bacterium 4484_70.1]
MQLLIIVLNREDYLEKILALMIEAGITGATILNSEGLGHFLAYEVPIFAGLRQLMGEKRSANRTIFAVVEEENWDEFRHLLEEENIDFTQSGVGIIALLPVNEVIKPKKK